MVRLPTFDHKVTGANPANAERDLKHKIVNTIADSVYHVAAVKSSKKLERHIAFGAFVFV